jgi:hypothetical protein
VAERESKPIQTSITPKMRPPSIVLSMIGKRWRNRGAGVLAVVFPIILALVAHKALGWWTTGTALQIAGLCDELIGLGATVLGIINTRRQFTDKPGIVDEVRASIRHAFGKLRGKPPTQKVAAKSLESQWGVGEPTVTQDDWRELTLEKRVDRLRDETRALRDDLTNKGQQLLQAIDAEAQTRDQLVKALRQRIAELAGGGLGLQTFGATSIFCGLGVTIIGVWIG